MNNLGYARSVMYVDGKKTNIDLSYLNAMESLT